MDKKERKSREQIERQIEHSKKYFRYVKYKSTFNDAVKTLKRTKMYLCDLYNHRDEYNIREDVEYYSTMLLYYKKIIKNISSELKKLKYELKTLS